MATGVREQPEPVVGEILVSAADLQRRVCELGEEITRDYAGPQALKSTRLKCSHLFLSGIL